MASSKRNCALLLAVAAAAFCVQLYQVAAHDFTGRCLCHDTVKFIRGNVSDFQVLERRPGCDRTELIITMETADNSTVKKCINTEGKMGKAFLRCWEGINKNETQKTLCIARKQRAELKSGRLSARGGARGAGASAGGSP